jgi:hypothetical protein
MNKINLTLIPCSPSNLLNILCNAEGRRLPCSPAYCIIVLKGTPKIPSNCTTTGWAPFETGTLKNRISKYNNCAGI